MEEDVGHRTGTILISVTDKTGLEKFARLQKMGWRIISTGGTFKELQRLGIDCERIEDITEFPEMMDGRLKTLHPKVHGGILADRSKREHLDKAMEHGIPLIDVVVVNLYDFEGNPSIENIDIGGPSMIRGAAKNGRHVSVVVDPKDYDKIVRFLEDIDVVPHVDREYLAAKAFEHTARYDAAIAKWMRERLDSYKGIFPL